MPDPVLLVQTDRCPEENGIKYAALYRTIKKQWLSQVNTTGIAIVILDHLAQKEWVREEYLLQELRIAPKLLLRALRFLEQERILRHDSRKEGKRAQQKDIVILATKSEIVDF